MKSLASALTLALLGLSLSAAEPKTTVRAEPATLKVKLDYTGAGKVDDKHHIVLFLFDAPNFSEGGVMPIASLQAAAKDETVTFTGLTANPVYIVVAYDPTGAYDGQSGPPPSGSSVSMYTKNPPAADPVKLDPAKPTEVTMTFNDSFKMP